MNVSGPLKQTGCDFTINAGQKFEIFSNTFLKFDRYVFNEYYAEDSTNRGNICAHADGHAFEIYNESIKRNAPLFDWYKFSAFLSYRFGYSIHGNWDKC